MGTTYNTTGAPVRNLDIDEGTSDTIKATAGRLYSIHLQNNNATDERYVKLYNQTSADQSDTPIVTLSVGPDRHRDIVFPGGMVFDTALSVRATTAAADNDTGAPGANEVSGVFFV